MCILLVRHIIYVKKNKRAAPKEREREHNMETMGIAGHGRKASPMTRPHVFWLVEFIRHIMGDAVCAWFGRKWVGTCRD